MEDFAVGEADGEGEAVAARDEDGDAAVFLGEEDVVAVEGDGGCALEFAGYGQWVFYRHRNRNSLARVLTRQSWCAVSGMLSAAASRAWRSGPLGMWICRTRLAASA